MSWHGFGNNGTQLSYLQAENGRLKEELKALRTEAQSLTKLVDTQGETIVELSGMVRRLEVELRQYKELSPELTEQVADIVWADA